jgi:hypothetical protein
MGLLESGLPLDESLTNEHTERYFLFSEIDFG